MFEVSALIIIVTIAFSLGYVAGNMAGHREHVEYFSKQQENKDEN